MKRFSLITIIVLAVSLFAMAQMKVLVYLSDGTIYENLVSRLDSITLFTQSVTPDEPNNPGNPDTPVNPDIPDNPPADDDAEQNIVLVAKKIENTNQVEIVAKCSVEPKSIIWEVKEDGGQYSQVANQNGKSLIITPYSETNTYVKAYMVNSKDEKIESAPIIVSSTCSNVVFIDDFGQFQGETERASSDFIGPEYTYVRECQALKAEGTYAVLVNSKYAGNGDGMEYNSCDITGRLWYRDICDHTQGGYKDGMWGGMLLVNADAELVYSRPVDVVPNTTMDFSAWVTNASKNELGTSACYSRITLVVKDEEGQELTSIDFNISCDDLSWKQGKVSFNTKENSKVSIELYNSLPGALGNDFLIDDISFSICDKQNFDFIEPNLVEFNANDGVGDILSEAVVPNSIYVIPSSTFTREGYEFTGWNTKADGTGTSYTAGTSVTITSNITLYAQWQEVATQPTINANGHEYVDLGLPSGILWATCNVGADSPEEYGDYFAWSETEPKDYYHWETYKLSANGNYYSMTKYCLSPSYGTVDNKNILELSDDAANANWGGDWRMPTIENFSELKTECTWSLVTKDGIRGFTVKGKNGNTIFLPEGGDYLGQDLSNVGSRGAYWSSNLGSHDAYSSCFYIGTSQEVNSSGYDRCRGYSVRPVLPKGIVIEPEKPDTPESSFVAKPFSISATETITFSPGNLQYNAANDVWRFAPSQLDYVGEDNANISSTYNGWIDLFGWGTGNNPTNIIEHYDYYQMYVDWGVNKIGSYASNTWRTLTNEEWRYIIYNRSSASNLKGVARVNGINGLILLPDFWQCPAGVTFKAGVHNYYGDVYYGEYQTISASDWYKLEASGAVFLPAAGERGGSIIRGVQYYGGYWSATNYLSGYAYHIYLYSNETAMSNSFRDVGKSVRLVKEYTEPEKPTLYTITFNANGGSGSMSSVSKEENTTYSIPSNTFTRSGYTFTGWNTKADGTGTSYSAGASVTMTSNITLYAQWNKNVVSYTISFNANGGSGSMSSVSKEEDTTYSIPSNTFTRSGYTFTGWNTKADGSGTSYTAGTSVTITSNITLYAQWQEVATQPTINANGHEYVDLGLPSGTLWATMNVGATSPEDYGDYFAWGETTTKSTYSWENYKWCNGSNTTITKYCTSSTYGTVDNKTTLDIADDVAHVKWGGDWRMPTKAEQDELLTECTWTWITKKGVNGYTVTGPNGNSIFLPAAGGCYDSSLDDAGSLGYYWSSSLSTNYSNCAYDLDFYSSNVYRGSYYRSRGLSVRPVLRVGFTYDAIFDSNGGEGTMPSIAIDHAGQLNIPENKFTRPGYEFIFWNTKADGSGTSYTAGASVTITSNIILYAQWNKNVVSYTITFNANGGSGSMSSVSKQENTTYSIPSNTFTRSGYTFTGWNTKADGSGTSYTAGTSVTITSNITFYAQWQEVATQPTINANGHEYVDLGLPSGTLWATMNVGATSPEDYGDYFAWGETTTKSSFTNSNSTYKWYDGYQYTKYIPYSYAYKEIMDDKSVLELCDDAANVNWGGDWRMPLQEEQQELLDECTWTYGAKNGVNGFYVKGPNGNSIFLPAAGKDGGDGTDLYCYIWSSNIHSVSDFRYASFLYLHYEKYYGKTLTTEIYGKYRYHGMSVRPVMRDGIIHSVVFNSNGGVGTMSSFSIEHAQSLIIPDNTFVREGYEFIDWNTKTDGTGTSYSVLKKNTITCNLTLYAQWYKKEDKVNHDYVDLGLPSGTLWATKNIGASSPEDYGDYFAWGETTPKSNYGLKTYKYSDGIRESITKYCTNSYYGVVDNKTVLEFSDDAAYVIWGSDWCMPTKEQQDELRTECTWKWTTLNGINGYKVTSRTNGNSIFLPASGYYTESILYSVGESGNYWSKSLYTGSSSEDAFSLSFSSSRVNYYDDYREDGNSIRPVLIRKAEPEKPVSYTISFNANGGSGSMSSVSKEENTTYSIPSNTFTRSGYTFTGWNTKADGAGTSYTAGTSVTITSNITFYAQWQEVATQPTINANGHEFVDLGLPSGTLWATKNIGASSPEDYGDYFAWGETGTKSTYSWENYKWCNGSNTTITKYCTSSTYGTVDNKTTLDIADDVAHVKWGGDWRMPTKAEQDELRSECTWVWTTLNGINGYKVTSRTNGNSIFLPAAGGRNSSESYDVGVGGYYWSSSLGTNYSIYSRYLYFLSEEVDWYDFYRDSGRSVRPVLK